jgi:putative transposase
MRIALERKYGLLVNKKCIARVQRKYDLQARIRRKRAYNETILLSYEGPKPNILNQEFHADRPNQKWVTDISYVGPPGKRQYLSAVMDLFNNEIVAFRLSRTQQIPFVLESLKDAFEKRKPEGVLVHSDQGGHYTSRQYCELLREYHAQQSMSRKGKCLDNASMECFFGHLKSELLRRIATKSRSEIAQNISSYINFYNQRRIQQKIKMAPIEYRSHFEKTFC